jgi:hypothetical protein
MLIWEADGVSTNREQNSNGLVFFDIPGLLVNPNMNELPSNISLSPYRTEVRKANTISEPF